MALDVKYLSGVKIGRMIREKEKKKISQKRAVV